MSVGYSARWRAEFGDVDPARTAADVAFLRGVLPLQSRQGERELRPGIVERSAVVHGRRRCELKYDDGTVDVFEWQLYTPDELELLAARCGLTPVETVAAAELPSMQFVLQRDG